ALVAVILMCEQYFHFVFGPFPIISSHSLKATGLPSSVEPGTPNMTGQNGRQEQSRSVPVRLLKKTFSTTTASSICICQNYNDLAAHRSGLKETTRVRAARAPLCPPSSKCQ